MHHHNGSGQELNASDKFCEGVVTKCKQKRRQPKCNPVNEQHLQHAEKSVEQGRTNVHLAPTPVNEPVLVRQDTKIEQHKGKNQ